MKLPKNIIDIIKSNKTSLGDNPAIPPELDEHFILFLVNEYYEDLLTHFDSVSIQELSEELSNSIAECKKIEKQNKEALEQLCFYIVNKLFNIPSDTLSINIEIVDRIDTRQERLFPEQTNYSFNDINEMVGLTDEIYKRRFLNALIVGISMYYSGNISSYKKLLDKINPKLASLYKKILYINNLLLFHTKHSVNKHNSSGGKVDVYLNSNNTPVEINSQGVIFPILLFETIKGVLELSIAHGLPSDKDKALFITSKADFKLAELWDERLGLPLWGQFVKLFKTINQKPTEVGLNFILMELSKLEPSQFNPIIQELLANTKTGVKLLNNLTSQILKDKEYDEFDEYIITKQNGNNFQINDDDMFTSDDLINNDLCSTMVLDEEI